MVTPVFIIADLAAKLMHQGLPAKKTVRLFVEINRLYLQNLHWRLLVGRLSLFGPAVAV